MNKHRNKNSYEDFREYVLRQVHIAIKNGHDKLIIESDEKEFIEKFIIECNFIEKFRDEIKQNEISVLRLKAEWNSFTYLSGLRITINGY